MNDMTTSVPMINQSNLMILANNLRTGNLILDMLLMTILSSLIASVLSIFNKNNFLWIIQALTRLFNNFWEEKPPLEESVTTYKVIINYEYVKSHSGNTGKSQNNFIIDNSIVFDALFSYFSKKSENMTSGEFAIKLPSHYDYDWQRVRSSDFRVKPLSQIIIDGFTVDFVENIVKPMAKEEKKKDKEEKTPTQVLLDMNSANEPQEKTSYQNRIIVSSTTKKLPEILEYVKSIYKEYINTHHPMPKVVSTVVPKYYLVKSGDLYKRYNLTSKTTFNHIFFPGKDKLLRQIDKFIGGKIPLSKFTILLHGPPGGGKTSFIKALHNLTGNHVIVVKLSQYSTLKELINTFHDECIHLTDGSIMNIPIDKRIYLFEDIDAEDEIVLKRDQAEQEMNSKYPTTTYQHSRYPHAMMSSRMPDSGRPYNRTSSGIRQKQKTATKSSPKTKRSDNSSDEDMPPLDIIAEEPAYPMDMWDMNYYQQKKPVAQSIKLADILNLLDGVLELCGCFVILTTNFKNKLDTALVRPGRVTYDLLLTHIKQAQMTEMLNKFVPDYSTQLSTLQVSNVLASVNNAEIVAKINDQALEKLGTNSGERLFEWILSEIESRNDCMPCRFESMCQNEEDISAVIRNLLEYIATPLKEQEAEYS